MPRRPVRNRSGFRSSGRVKGQLVHLVFNCAGAGCSAILTVAEGELVEHAEFRCPSCGFLNERMVASTGDRWKYCVRCERLKPLSQFDRHGRLRSGHQSECRECKKNINQFGNRLRTKDQLREGAEGRRLFGAIVDDTRVSLDGLMDRFRGRCFNCGKPVHPGSAGPDAARVDHTLPARYLWPAGLGATLLCGQCNGAKRDRWPSEFYDREHLKQLSVLTGIAFDLLSASPMVNPAAVTAMKAGIDAILVDFAPYPEKVRTVRKLVLDMTGEDILEGASTVPPWARSD